MSELGLVTPAGKVVWGKKIFTISIIFVVLCFASNAVFFFSLSFFFFLTYVMDGCREIRTSD